METTIDALQIYLPSCDIIDTEIHALGRSCKSQREHGTWSTRRIAWSKRGGRLVAKREQLIELPHSPLSAQRYGYLQNPYSGQPLLSFLPSRLNKSNMWIS
jgi:hypothetical protein